MYLYYVRYIYYLLSSVIIMYDIKRIKTSIICIAIIYVIH